MDADRLQAELALLRTAYPDLVHVVADDGVHWVKIPNYPLPAGWYSNGIPCASVEAALRIPTQAAQAPYGFLVRPVIQLANNAAPSNYSPNVATPWGSEFAQFSWSPLGPWIPKTDVTAGANMLNFARSFADRLGELS